MVEVSQQQSGVWNSKKIIVRRPADRKRCDRKPTNMQTFENFSSKTGLDFGNQQNHALYREFIEHVKEKWLVGLDARFNAIAGAILESCENSGSSKGLALIKYFYP